MNEHDFESRGRSQERMADRNFDDKIQSSPGTEEQLPQSSSDGASLPGVLNGICSSLDCQIGSVVSLISLSGDDASDVAEIAMNAALFGLYVFCSESVIAGNDELLGFLR